uniref:Retroviral polymerase SH3-like domain-containing protein n=1 Tax=Tanacetum cinerariifolium TaxID=118510 RepID=A0A6L2MAA6_TANCI|nr:hypothetical protein [Tanacetum cinerariifolium]
MKPFGYPVTILNTKDYLGKFDKKADEGFFIGYSVVSKAMRVFNKRTRIVEETLNIRFLKNASNVKGNGPDWLFDIDSLTISMNYVPVVAGFQTNGITGTKDNIVAGPKDSAVDARKKATEVDDSQVLDNDRHDAQVTRSEFEGTLQQKKQTEHINSTDSFNTVSSPVSTIGPSSVNDALPSPINAAGTHASTNAFEEHPFERFYPFKNAFCLPYVPIVTLINDTGIFGNAYDDEVVEEKVDINNVDSSYTIPDDPLTKFLKDHPKDQKSDGIFISQDKYVADILKKFDFSTVKTTCTLMKPNKALVKDVKAKDVDVHLYRLMIGSLMYLTASSPDITFAICACARKSTTGGCQFLNKRLISWQCKKKTIFANSTTKEEYVAAASCRGQVLWIQSQMLDYGFNLMNTKIYIDNESTIYIVKNLVFHSKTKKIEIRHHFIKDLYEKKLIQVIKIHTDHNIADLFTKAFDVTKISQSSGPTNLVAYKTVYKEWEDRMERAATTASSLEAKQESGNINMTQSMATLNEPFPEGTSSGSGCRCQVTILGGVEAQTRFEAASKQSNDLPLSRAKPSESEGFEKIIDFLNAKPIRYALTVNLTVYASCVKQFWTTTKVKKVNGQEEIQALADKQKVIITKESIRRDLKFDDAEGTLCLPNDTIFAELARMGNVTPLFETMMVTAQEEVGEGSAEVYSPSSEIPVEENILTPSNDPLPSEEAKIAQEKEIAKLKRRVKKIEKSRKLRPAGLRRLKKGRMHDADMFGVDDLEGNEVFVDVREQIVEKEVKTADLVTTAGQIVTAASVEDSVVPTTITIADVDDELTLAKTLIAIKAAKPKEERSKIEEEERIAREKDEANGYVNEEWDDVQATIDADRRKYLATKKAKEIMNKPPTKAQQKSLMCTYMRNIEGFKQKDFKGKNFDDIRKIFDKVYKRVNTFVDMDTENVEEILKKTQAKGSSKRARKELEQESAKKQKLAEQVQAKVANNDTTELKRCLKIVPEDDDDVAIEATPLSSKSSTIVYHKIYKEGEKSYFKIIRADRNSQKYLTFGTMFKNFNREDFKVLRSIVKKKFKKTKPVDDIENLLFQTLKTMFEPHVEDII